MTSRDDRPPVQHLLDVFVYAPIGLAVSARQLLPELIEKGRAQVSGQVQTAKVVGQFATQHGRQEVERRVGDVRQQAIDTLERLSGPNDLPVEGTAAPSPAPPEPATVPTSNGSGPPVDGLAIPDYDALAASQVVSRLSGLDLDELEAVRAYEAGHRGRKTILNKISQLQKD